MCKGYAGLGWVLCVKVKLVFLASFIVSQIKVGGIYFLMGIKGSNS